MRKAFIRSLIKIACQDERVMLITGDLGYLVIEEFIERFPDRFLNAGVAEQNILGMATGLAEAGFIPYVYSITPFVSLRPFEFIRNGPVYHNLPIRIVGIGQGVEYGLNGLSHYALEDVGVLRTQPGLTIIAPADDAQAQNAIEQTYHLPSPIYYRLSKDSAQIQGLDGNFGLGQAQQIDNGKDFVIVSSGAITQEAIKAVQILNAKGLSGTILVVASVAPAPQKDIIETLANFKFAFTLEAHYVTGGIGSLVAEILAENRLPTQLTRFGFKSIPNEKVGSVASIYNDNDLSAEKISRQIQKVLQDHA